MNHPNLACWQKRTPFKCDKGFEKKNYQIAAKMNCNETNFDRLSNNQFVHSLIRIDTLG